MVPSLGCTSELVLSILIQKPELHAGVIQQNLQRQSEVLYVIFMWENSCGSTKKKCETIQVVEVRRKECVFTLAAERMCPVFRVYWFHN